MRSSYWPQAARAPCDVLYASWTSEAISLTDHPNDMATEDHMGFQNRSSAFPSVRSAAALSRQKMKKPHHTCMHDLMLSHMNFFFGQMSQYSVHFLQILSCFPQGKEIYSKAVAGLIPGLGLRFVEIRARSNGPLHTTRVVNPTERHHHAQGVKWIHYREVLDCLSL